MKAVTGAVELRSKDKREIERFVGKHLESLEDHALTIRLGKDAYYIVEFFSSDEPNP